MIEQVLTWPEANHISVEIAEWIPDGPPQFAIPNRFIGPELIVLWVGHWVVTVAEPEKRI